MATTPTCKFRSRNDPVLGKSNRRCRRHSQNRVDGIRWSASSFLLLVVSACAALPIGEREVLHSSPKRGAVASEHPLATAAGLAILERGGNAADAAVATALVLAVVYPQAGSLGGGGFALWVPKGGKAPLALDYRETAPAALDSGDYLIDGEVDPLLPKRGHLAVGVPGVPAGLWKLANELGTLPFEELAAPAIALARGGFAVDAWLEHHLSIPSVRAQLSNSPAAQQTFYPGGVALEENHLFVQPALANTLELLATKGSAGFYEGFVADALVSDMENHGGLLSREDLANYRAIWRTPITGWFRGYEVVSMPPPSSGGIVLLQALRILDGFPLDSERETARMEAKPSGPVDSSGLNGLAVHWWIEALRMGFADRAEHMGDPGFWEVPQDKLLSSEWIAKRRTAIGGEAGTNVGPMPLPEAAQASSETSETTHLSVLDEEGNAISLTTTLNGLFGSGVVVGPIGVVLNNEMDDFSIQPGVPNEYGLVGSEANSIVGGKRPLSSMTPTVLRDGGQTVVLVIGAPGGPRIISAVLQVVLRKLVYRMELASAVHAPRLHQQWNPSGTFVEAGWPEPTLAELRERGHELLPMPSRSSIQAIWVARDGEPQAVSDSRRGGVGGVVGESLPAAAAAPVDENAYYARPTPR